MSRCQQAPWLQPTDSRFSPVLRACVDCMGASAQGWGKVESPAAFPSVPPWPLLPPLPGSSISFSCLESLITRKASQPYAPYLSSTHLHIRKQLLNP